MWGSKRRSQTDCITLRASWGLFTGTDDLLSVGSSFHDQLLSCCFFSRMKPSRSTIISTHIIKEHSDPEEIVIKLTGKAWWFLPSSPVLLPPLPFPLPFSISFPLKKTTRNSPTSRYNPDLLYCFLPPPCCISSTCWVSSVVHPSVSMETDSSEGRAIWTQPHPQPPAFWDQSVFDPRAERWRTYLLYREAKMCWPPEILSLCGPLYKPGRKLKRTHFVSCRIRKAAPTLRGCKHQKRDSQQQ